MLEITAAKQNIGKRKKKWRQPKSPLGQLTNIHIIGVTGGERKREKGPKKIFEDVIAENFPNMEKEKVNQVQVAESQEG